jgi:hypothetical protein
MGESHPARRSGDNLSGRLSGDRGKTLIGSQASDGRGGGEPALRALRSMPAAFVRARTAAVAFLWRDFIALTSRSAGLVFRYGGFRASKNSG